MYSLDKQLQQDTVLLGQFPLCDVLLMNDSQYPWVILVPRRASIRESYHLSQEEQHQLSDESAYVSQRMADFFEAVSMNVAALGNVVSQLHVHHVVRFSDDPTWPKPVWGALPAKPYSKPELAKVVDDLSRLLSDKLIEAEQAGGSSSDDNDLY
jgi:diadenosine tetraphosphate (Ap4A) HIT family hydrolase